MEKTSAIVVWIVAALALFGIEATTVSFVALYFGVGALVSALAAALGAGLAEHGVLVRRELLAPLGVGLVDVVCHVRTSWFRPGRVSTGHRASLD